MKPSDLSILWRHTENELLCALLHKVTSGDGILSHRILEAQHKYFEDLQDAAYKKWQRKKTKGEIWDFLLKLSTPRFKLPSLKKGKDHKAILEGKKSLIRDELARLTYNDLLALLKKNVKPRYNSPVAKKLNVHKCVKVALGVNHIPGWWLERWQDKSREKIALEATAWHYDVAPSTLKRKILPEK